MSIIERAAEKMRLAAAAEATDDRDLAEAPAAEAPPEGMRDEALALPEPVVERPAALAAVAPEPIVSSIERAASLPRSEPMRSLDRPATLTLADEQNQRARGRTSRLLELDLDGLHARGYLNGRDDNPRLRDELRRLKRPLLTQVKSVALENGSAGLENVIIVTSAMPGEGKTFTSLNLAISIASEIDQTVLLIDADFRRRSASGLLSCSESPGFIDLLEGRGVSVPDVILRTNIETLNVIPAGRAHTHADELFASEVAASVLSEISARYDDRIIIIDTPPVLLTSEAMVLAQWARHVLFVVEADKTPQEQVLDAVRTLAADNKIRLVLNKSSRRAAALGRDGYGSYYYYRS